MTKAIYMGAHVGTMAGEALVISFAGEPHRATCRGVPRTTSNAALAAAAGRPFHCHWSSITSATTTTSCSSKRAEPAQADEDIDTGDLVDVPPEAIVSPIDRLTQAFPGSEIIEERT